MFVILAKSGFNLGEHAPEIIKCAIQTTGYDLEPFNSLVKSIETLCDNIIKAGSEN